MVSWKRNLVFVWISQFLSIAGFAFALPFAPYYIQELGVTDPVRLKIWLAMFTAAAPVSLAIFSPFWGWVADRYGRRLMLLRANLGAAVMLALMGRAESVVALVLLRAMQGLLTGTMTAAQTLVASSAPSQHSGFVMGALSSSVFSGAMAGMALGGLFADAFGYRTAFFLASGLLLIASLLVTFGTREDFRRTAPVGGTARQRVQRGILTLTPIMHLLLPLAAVAMLRRFDATYLPLLVQEIHGSLAGSATRMGILASAACAAGFIAGFFFGHMSDRVSPRTLARFGALAGGCFMIPQTFAFNLPVLLVLRFVMAFCVGGIEPVFQGILARISPRGERGFIFGWAATVRAVGWGLAPLLSGIVATLFSVRAVFLVGGVLLMLLAWWLPGQDRADSLSEG